MGPRVSILIPSFNHARFLGAAVEGVLSQDFEDWELILVDDCSKDDSVAVARSFKDPRIQVDVNDCNLGTYGTQQKALDMARGEYVAILNSDDLWAPTKLRKEVEALDAEPDCGFCYVLGWMIDAEGAIDQTEDVHAYWPTEPKQELLPFLLFENRALASGILFRKQGLRFETSLRYSGDWVALLEAARRGPCACVAERLTYWRIHGANSFTASQNQFIEEIRVRRSIDRHEGWYVPRLERKAVRGGLGKNAINLLALCSVFLDGPSTRSACAAVLRLHPNKKTALKRALAALVLPGLLRRHLWGTKLDFATIDEAAGRDAIRSQELLLFAD